MSVKMSSVSVFPDECFVERMERSVVPFSMCLNVDITDFLKEEIRGPASFSCNGKVDGCRFEEPAMNDLIGSVFGDKSIFLNCESSECLYYTEIPGYKVPRWHASLNISVPRNQTTLS